MNRFRGAIVPIALLILWEILSRVGVFSPIVLPPPSAVAVKWYSGLLPGLPMLTGRGRSIVSTASRCASAGLCPDRSDRGCRASGTGFLCSSLTRALLGVPGGAGHPLARSQVH